MKRIFYGFELTLPEGTKYIFGNTPSSIEFTNKYLNTIWSYHKDNTANVWHLTKIISPSKQTIDFSYDRGVIVMQQINYEEFSVFWERRRSKIGQHGFFFKGLPILFYPVYLKEIKCSKAKIVFERSLSKQLDYHMRWAYDLERGYDDLYSHYAFDQFHWYKLDGFTVYDPKDKAVRKINFSYQDQEDKRLFLQAVSIGDKKYQLKYNTLELPGYNGRELDHWGYYNGRDFFQSYSFTDARGRLKSLEAIKNDLKNNYPSSRAPDAYYAQAGILTRIIYPTGGFINFTYELNDHIYIVDKYPSVNNGNPYFSLRYKIGKGGGLRIKQMTAYEKDGKKSLDKEFIYRRDYLSGGTRSSGTLAGESIYFEQGNASHGDFWVWTNSAREILNTTSGNMVTYSEVVEKDRLNGGGIVYKYTNHDQLAYRDHLADIYISFNHLPYRYAAYNKNVERGNLLEKIVFDKDRKVVRKEKYTYKKLDTWQSSTVRAYDRQNQQYLSLRRLQVGGSEVIIPPSFNQRVSAYKIFTYTPLLSSKEITEYFHGRALTTENHYFYNYDPPILKKQTTTNSKNQIIETTYQYAHDLSDQRLIDENRIVAPLKTTVKKGGKVLSQQQTKYGSFGSLYLPQFVLAKKGSVALSETRDKKITYDRYDAKGNLLQYHTENGLTTSILWDRTGEYPIAKVEGAAYSQISRYQSHPEDLRTALPKARVTTYTYQPLVGITSITKPNGQKERYEYDEFNRLKTVKDHQGKILRQYEYHYRNSK